ncbi:MAG: FecR family protein [Bacteroidales bacterium]|nr:FecR family protein [Bacteroidales bacterium]
MNKRERYTDEEWEKLASLLSGEKEEHTELLDRFMADDYSNTGKQWEELRNMNNEKKIDVDKAWNNVYGRMNEAGFKSDHEPSGTSVFRSHLMKIAAAALVLLALGATALYFNNSGLLSKKLTASTGNDQKNLQVVLPDGSRIFLNRNSELSYHAKFAKNKREVKLTGEAFFEITPDSLHPFIIDAGKAIIKVLGTSFNVITENAESSVEVFVKTGKVMLTDNSGSQSVIIDPGFVGTMDSKMNEKKINNDPNYLSWQTGLLVYNGQKLDVVLKDLKRVYNMKITADDPTILENRWTTPIDNQPQDTIIRLICASFNLRYTKDGNIYHLKNE